MVDILKAHGWTGAYRNAQSGAFGGGDIIGGPSGFHIEVKYCETAKPWEWLRQAESEARPTDIAAVVCRCNRMPWFAVLPADEWEPLAQLAAVDSTVAGVARGLEYVVVKGPGKRLSLWRDIVEAVRLAGAGGRPRVLFAREGSPWYVAVPLLELLPLLWARERGL